MLLAICFPEATLASLCGTIPRWCAREGSNARRRGLSLTRIEFERESLGHLLKDRQLRVPRFQRSYAWQERHVRELLDDVGAALDAGEEEYFLGSIVISGGEGADEVVDGQQRLATAAVFIGAVRDALVSRGHAERARTVAGEFLATQHRRTQELVPKLTLNELDHEFFMAQVITPPDDATARKKAPARASHERLQAAKAVAEEKVAAIVAATKDPEERLLDWIDFLEEKARVICVSVPDHANAFVIFETLNDRGLDLSIADLLKNYLFGRADNRIAEVQGRWMRMLGALEAAGGEELVLSYLRHLWSSIHGATRERELYTKIKSSLKTKQKVVDFADTLGENAKYYAAIVNPRDRFWRKLGGSARGHIEALSYLRMEQFRPLLLAALAHLKDNEVRKLLRYLVSASVRFLVVGGLGGGTMEKAYADAAQAISSGKFTSASDVAKSLSKLVPADKPFEAGFANVTVQQSYLARYYLRAIERTSMKQAEPEFVPNDNEDEVNLEHVLPQNPSVAWKMPADDALRYYNRLGNLALMQKRPNRAAANKGFAAKKVYYKKSKLTHTLELASESKWGAQEIEARQGRLAQLAVKTWSLKLRA